MTPQFYPAKILSYNKHHRTCQVAIPGFTDGLDNGLTASIAYPVGDDDKDTDRLITTPADCWVFFEGGDIVHPVPVVAFFRSHKAGVATDTRRIRQQNIELLAGKNITLACDTLDITAKNINITGDLNIKGNTTQQGVIKATDVMAGVVSLFRHIHGVLTNTTTPPR